MIQLLNRVFAVDVFEDYDVLGGGDLRTAVKRYAGVHPSMRTLNYGHRGHNFLGSKKSILNIY